MQIKSFRFSLQELGGALGDLGTLLPLMVALVLTNGLSVTSVLSGVGFFYIASGLYFRIPMPVQPLKAAAVIAISGGLSASVIGAAGLLIGVILLLLSLTNLIAPVVKLFPRPVIKGIQLSIGLMLLQKGAELGFGRQLFAGGAAAPSTAFPIGLLLAFLTICLFVIFRFVPFGQRQRFPASLAVVIFGLGSGVMFGGSYGVGRPGLEVPVIAVPSVSDLSLALTALVIPQLPLTLGNSVVATWDTARTYFKERAHRVSPRTLTASLGLANVVAGLFGAMPMCHGSGGLTAHYKLGARTGGANLMIGGLLLVGGLLFGTASLSFFSLIPLPVLGVLLAIVGLYHCFLIRDLESGRQLALAGAVAAATIVFGTLTHGLVAGIALYYLAKPVQRGWYLGLRSLRIVFKPTSQIRD